MIGRGVDVEFRDETVTRDRLKGARVCFFEEPWRFRLRPVYRGEGAEFRTETITDSIKEAKTCFFGN